jgi:hypothetical protein
MWNLINKKERAKGINHENNELVKEILPIDDFFIQNQNLKLK